jgi:RNA polymerase sigma factor (sigma-70 family)
LLRAFAEVREELLGTLAGHLGSHEDAQDVAQETFLKCWRARRKLRRVRNLKAWIFRIALNAARDLQRNAWRRKSRPLELAPTFTPQPLVSPGDVMVHGEDLDRLRTALFDLRPEERDLRRDRGPAVSSSRDGQDLDADGPHQAPEGVAGAGGAVNPRNRSHVSSATRVFASRIVPSSAQASASVHGTTFGWMCSSASSFCGPGVSPSATYRYILSLRRPGDW